VSTALAVGLPLLFLFIIPLGVFVLYSTISTAVLVRNRLYHTKLGHQCIVFAEDLPGVSAFQLYSSFKRLSSLFPDQTNEELWDALDDGRRDLRGAIKILREIEAILDSESDDQVDFVFVA